MQTLPRTDFEVLVVMNGEPDGTPEVVRAVRELYPDLCLRTLTVPEQGAGLARNVGLEAVRGRYVTFLDDDDALGPDFLRAMLASAGPDVIVAAPVHEVRSGGGHGAGTYITRGLQLAAGRTLRVSEVPVVCEYNAAKLVSTDAARSARYDVGLRSGEDLVYWLSVCSRHPMRVTVLADRPEHAYVRTVRDGGVSRQPPSFDFRVTQRLECVAALDAVDRSDPDVERVAATLVRAQAQWVNDYLRDHPEERDRVVAEVGRLQLADLPWHVVNAGVARQLALLYCFPPDLDTSGIVAAKRLGEGGVVTDVVSADLSAVRSADPRALRLVGPSRGRHHVVGGPASFHQWGPVRRYVEEAWSVVERWEADHRAGGYDRVYSRAMAVGSHYAAALVKVRRPDIVWTAEFSDPLRYNPLGQERLGDLDDGEVVAELLAALAASGAEVPADPQLFDLAERLAYALADRIVFTNTHQRDHMLGYCTDPVLRQRVEERGEIWPHPVPAPAMYDVAPPPLALAPGVVHLAYFGVFYATRDLSVLLDALAALDPDEQQRVQLHVFTPQPRRLEARVIALGLADLVRVRPYLGYFDFLALAQEVDVLVVNDAETAAHHEVNPYLPSKLSDYRGSGTAIWAVYEPGSVLSSQPVAHRSPLGDVAAAVQVVRAVLAEAGGTAVDSWESLIPAQDLS